MRRPVKLPGPIPTARTVELVAAASVARRALDDRRSPCSSATLPLSRARGDDAVARDCGRKGAQRSVDGKNVHWGGRRDNMRGSSPAPSISISYRRDGITSGALRHHSTKTIDSPSKASSRPSSAISRGIVEPEEVDVVDRRIAVVAVPERKGGTEALVGPVQRSNDGADEGGLAGTERAGERDDVAATEVARKGGGKRVEFVFGVKSDTKFHLYR